jgi:hypothetical protein
MANLIRRWKRGMGIGCSHGDLIHPQHLKDALEFKRRFKPDIRFHLGDLVDTSCFRSGAAGSKDEFRSPRDDMSAAAQLLDAYEPTHLTWGNHDWRLYELKSHPKAIVSTLAGQLWEDLQKRIRALKTKTCPYDIQDGWLNEFGMFWGHGYMFSMMALRDHAEMLGGPVAMAHTHHAHQVDGRTVRDSASFCVGALADDRQLTYGRRRRQSLTHGPGILYGEMSDKESHLWLIRGELGKPLHFPPGI